MDKPSFSYKILYAFSFQNLMVFKKHAYDLLRNIKLPAYGTGPGGGFNSAKRTFSILLTSSLSDDVPGTPDGQLDRSPRNSSYSNIVIRLKEMTSSPCKEGTP